MTEYIAKRSFYGDLGSVRRRQILTIKDSRLVEQLTARGLIEVHKAPPAPSEDHPTPKPKAKDKA